MKKVVIVLFFLGCSWAHSQSTWFTVMGDPANPSVDTIDVDPTPVSVAAETQTMRIRVSREILRTSWDGVPYRSYVSNVVFDCANKTAHYASITFYMQPVWQGDPHKTSTYTKANVHPMLFLDVTPNPTARIIRAACESGRVTTSDRQPEPEPGDQRTRLL